MMTATTHHPIRSLKHSHPYFQRGTMRCMLVIISASILLSFGDGFVLRGPPTCARRERLGFLCAAASAATTTGVDGTNLDHERVLATDESRRKLLSSVVPTLATLTLSVMSNPSQAHAIGPVKIGLTPTSYSALPCPKNRPIPGQKAMAGMRGLCVTVQATLDEAPPKDLSKVGVYGFITDGESGDSVLANNPDLSTDAGQFAMIESITTKDRKIQFDFVAAVPAEKDLSGYDNGIGPLNFDSLKVISFPGGEQYGAISPCEMNEFSDECEAWEQENGPYERGDFMMKSKSNRKG